jgi:hypothetical protein
MDTVCPTQTTRKVRLRKRLVLATSYTPLSVSVFPDMDIRHSGQYSCLKPPAARLQPPDARRQGDYDSLIRGSDISDRPDENKDDEPPSE